MDAVDRNDAKAIGRAVREARLAREATQAQLAEAAGDYAPTLVSKIERGQVRRLSVALTRVLELLGLELVEVERWRGGGLRVVPVDPPAPPPPDAVIFQSSAKHGPAHRLQLETANSVDLRNRRGRLLRITLRAQADVNVTRRSGDTDLVRFELQHPIHVEVIDET